MAKKSTEVLSSTEINVRKCARCGQDHVGLEFKEFERPVAMPKKTWTHWALCPNTGDPIILAPDIEK